MAPFIQPVQRYHIHLVYVTLFCNMFCKKPVWIGKPMLLFTKRVISFFFIVIAIQLVFVPVGGFAQSRLKKCPTNQSQRYHICYGTYTTPNGNKYVGEWLNNKRHGKGTYIFANGNKYVGEYRNGKWHGKGTLTYADGGKYVGEWRDDKYHGHGALTYANGDKRVGEWQNGKTTIKTSPAKPVPSNNEAHIRIEKLQKKGP